MKSVIEEQLKRATIENSSEQFKKDYKYKTLEQVISDLDNKNNRYVFYCPDIVLVNSLVKLIYETAYEAWAEGYEVVILHEINGFKCKWLYELEEYKHLKDIPVDYIIKKKGAKTKRTSNQYAFKPADTLVVPDQFIEMLENLVSVKILQKVVLVTSYTGLSSIQPGTDFKSLGVDKVIFAEKTLARDYSSLFSGLDAAFIDKYPINADIFKVRDEKNVIPLITVSQIGNNDFVQQVINVFYNKYPNLRVFNFRLLDRNNMNLYTENLNRAAMLLVLDKSLASMQMIYEAIQMGCPVGTTKRQEAEREIAENTYLGDTAFEVADNLAFFCQTWLGNRTKVFTEETLKFKDLSEYTYENFGKQVIDVVEELRQKRIEFFTKVKASTDAAVSTGNK